MFDEIFDVTNLLKYQNPMPLANMKNNNLGIKNKIPLPNNTGNSNSNKFNPNNAKALPRLYSANPRLYAEKMKLECEMVDKQDKFDSYARASRYSFYLDKDKKGKEVS